MLDKYLDLAKELKIKDKVVEHEGDDDINCIRDFWKGWTEN